MSFKPYEFKLYFLICLIFLLFFFEISYIEKKLSNNGNFNSSYSHIHSGFEVLNETDITEYGQISSSAYLLTEEKLVDKVFPNSSDLDNPPWLYPYKDPDAYFGLPYPQSHYVAMDFSTGSSSDSIWIQLSFNTVKNFTRFILCPYISTTGFHHYYPIDFFLQTSCGGTIWTTIKEVRDNNECFLNISIEGSGKHIRLLCNNPNNIGSVELQIMGAHHNETCIEESDDPPNNNGNNPVPIDYDLMNFLIICFEAAVTGAISTLVGLLIRRYFKKKRI